MTNDGEKHVAPQAPLRAAFLLLAVSLFACINSSACVSVGGSVAVTASGSFYNRPNSGPETLDLIKARGFIGEHYVIKSEDGYPISVYRIINPLANQDTLNRYPVAVLHGIGGDASQLVSQSFNSRPRKPILGEITYGPGDECLAFMLSNNNYDVFLVDARGSNLNDHSVYLDFDLKNGAKFWNFTLDEQVVHDTPAIVDFILGQTGSDKLHYIGYSETTLFMFAYLTLNPAYQSKLASFVAMAPVAYVTHFTGAGLAAATALTLYPDELSYNYFPQIWIDSVGVALRRLCSKKLAAQAVCSPIARSLSGWGGQSDPTGYFSTLFKGTSIRAFKHFAQLHFQGRFGMYDYGWAGNMAKYGRPQAPSYDLSRITMPNLILIRGGNDYLSNVKDQTRLLSELGTKPYADIFLPNYNHLDFLISSTLMLDANLPINKLLLKLTIQQAAPWTPFKQPHEPSSTRFHPIKPVGVAIPDRVSSDLLNSDSHLLKNVFEGVLTGMNSNGGGAWNRIAQPLKSIGLERAGHLIMAPSPESLQRIGGFGGKLDSLGNSLNGNAKLLLNPFFG